MARQARRSFEIFTKGERGVTFKQFSAGENVFTIQIIKYARE